MLGVIQQRAHSLSSRKVCPASPTVMRIQSFTSNYTHQVASSSVRLPSSGRARRNVVVHNDTPGWAGGNSTEKAMFGDVSRLGGLCGATHSMELSTLSPSPACATHHHLNPACVTAQSHRIAHLCFILAVVLHHLRHCTML